MTGRDHLGEIAVGRSDDARVESPRLVRPYTLEPSLFERAEKLGLTGEWQFGDLVEENCPLTGRFECAHPRPDRPRIRAALVAEQLALDEALGNGGAVDDAKRVGGATPASVQTTREETLAGTTLAQQKDRRRRTGKTRHDPRDVSRGGGVAREGGAPDGHRRRVVAKLLDHVRSFRNYVDGSDLYPRNVHTVSLPLRFLTEPSRPTRHARE